MGAGRVEDTVNLLGHAARNVVAIAATLSGQSKEEVAQEAGAGLLNFGSIKSGLDLQWGEEGNLEEGVWSLSATGKVHQSQRGRWQDGASR